MAFFAFSYKGRRQIAYGLAIATLGVLSWTAATSQFNESVSLQSLALWAVTWSGLLVFLVRIDPADAYLSVSRLADIALWLIVIQSVWAVAQVAYGVRITGTWDSSTGDFIDGFVHPSLSAAGSFANPTFSAGLVVLLLVSLGGYLQTHRYRYLAVSCLAASIIGLASVMHQVAFLIVSLVIAAGYVVLRRRTFQHVAPVALTLLALLATAVLLHPRNTRSGSAQVAELARSALELSNMPSSNTDETLVPSSNTDETLVGDDRSVADDYRSLDAHGRAELSRIIRHSPNPKVSLLWSVFEKDRNSPLALMVGWGPGTFASRAAAVRTGLYFGSPANPRPVPLIDTEVTPLFEEHLLHPWLRVVFAKARFGSSHKPFSSWLSVLSETGLLGVVTVLVLCSWAVWMVSTRATNPMPLLIFLTLTGFFFLLGWQEHYWEMPQIALLQLFTIRLYFSAAFNQST